MRLHCGNTFLKSRIDWSNLMTINSMWINNMNSVWDAGFQLGRFSRETLWKKAMMQTKTLNYSSITTFVSIAPFMHTH